MATNQENWGRYCGEAVQKQSSGGAEKIPALPMDQFLENGGHHWEEGMEVYRFSWPSSLSLVPILNWLAHLLFRPVFLQILLCESTAQVGGFTQEKLQLFVSLGKEDESDGGRDQLLRNPEEEMETIPWMTVLSWILLEAGSQADSSLPRPRLSSPLSSNFIIKGEEIPLNCSLPEGVESGSPEGPRRIRFYFFCKDQSYKIIEDEHLSNNTFNLRTEYLSSGQIKIICICKFKEKYWTQPYSPESNQLVFSVVDVLPSPLLKVDPLSQRVKEGDPLVFLCSMEGGDREKRFHFYKDGVEITSREEALLEPSSESTNPLQNASLRIPHASINHSGEFACSYEEKRSNRWVTSSWSQGTNITVEPVSTQDSDLVWRYSWMAIPLIILLVPFAFYCWRKKSTPVSQERFQL
ncbi:uncharacterized protein LOC113450678, partial [Pseudonaja textilis]|uniref:uncharacterized protein LOC113450678 n=1 Tax=Pseudonaja textilis TaxID=8673 RepID=UPI000EA9D822